jgi:hypothetical protein
MDLKIISIEGTFVADIKYMQYITCIQVMLGKVISYEVGSNNPFIFKNESLLNQTLLMLRNDLINKKGIFKVRNGDIPLLTFELDDIQVNKYNKDINYDDFTDLS